MFKLRRNAVNFLQEEEGREKTTRTYYIFQDQKEALDSLGHPSRRVRQILDYHLHDELPRDLMLEGLEVILGRAESSEVIEAAEILQEWVINLDEQPSHDSLKPGDKGWEI